MKYVRKSQKVMAVVMCVAVWHLCVVAGFAQDIATAPAGPPAFSSPLTDMMKTGSAGLDPALARSVVAYPRAVTGSVGQVTWKSVTRSSPLWTCRTGTGSAVSLDLAAAGRVSIHADSHVALHVAGDDLVIDLVRGALRLEGPAGARVQLRTFDGVYRPSESESYNARIGWRDGALALEGSGLTRVEGKAAEIGLQLANDQRVRLANGKPGKLGVRVVDATGEPVQGVPVVFSAGKGRVSFAGSPVATVLTDAEGVAETTATAFGSGIPVEIAAEVAGTETTAAVQADVDQTTGGQKVMAWIVMGVLAAATVVLVLAAQNEDDPELRPGSATRVAP
jgi:hypothetical protein